MSQPAYGEFAGIYDAFMLDAPYEAWVSVFRDVDVLQKGIADVGCGTGTLAVDLAVRGARVIGVDLSSEMLTAAANRAAKRRVQATWLCQDMRELKLPRPVDVIVSTCDSLNYVLTEAELMQTCTRFYESLVPGGQLCFDLLGPKRIEMLSDGVWYDLREDAELWFTSEVGETGRIEYEVHAFLKDESRDLYRRVVEHHTEQFYPQDVVERVLGAAGFRLNRVEGDFGQSSPGVADRLVFYATKV